MITRVSFFGAEVAGAGPARADVNGAFDRNAGGALLKRTGASSLRAGEIALHTIAEKRMHFVFIEKE